MYLPLLAPWSTALGFALSVVQQPPPAPAPARFELPTKLAPGESRLLEIRTATSSAFRIDVAGKATEMKQRDESTTWIVDTLLDPASQPKDHFWSGRRRIVKAQSTRDGVVDDPETNGFEANVWCDTTGHIHLESATERRLNQGVLQELLNAVEAFGLGIGVQLPSSSTVGAEFDLPFAVLAPWCLTVDGKASRANAHLRFESVDAARNLALFKGPVHVEEEFERSAEELEAPFGMKGTGTYDGEVALEYDLAARRIARIVCHAKANLDGVLTGSATAKVTGTHGIDSTLTCSGGAAAGAALNQKTQYREVPHSIANSGVSIALPSHFTKFALKDPLYNGFRSLLRGDGQLAIVLVYPIAEPGKTLKDVGEEGKRGLEKSGFTVKLGSATCGLGTSVALDYTDAKVHGLDVLCMLEPGRFVAVQCSCPVGLYAELSREWPRYLQTLKKLPAAK